MNPYLVLLSVVAVVVIVGIYKSVTSNKSDVNPNPAQPVVRNNPRAGK